MLNRLAAAWACALLAAFCALAFAVVQVPGLAGVIDAPAGAFFGNPSPALATAALAITFLGSAAGIVIVMFGVAAYFPTPRIVARLIIAVGAAAAAADYLKSVFERVRPPGASLYVADASYSFPSGHATAAMALYSFIACLCYVRARTPGRRALAVALPAALILLIGASRLVLGVHYATDVLGGYLLGAFWTAFAFSLPPRIRIR
ncbi:MAG TPA: phosphatase PAP2 family protein [Candidatus Paceibacterota bacterium]